MERPNGMKGSKHYHRYGDAPFIEAPDWPSLGQVARLVAPG